MKTRKKAGRWKYAAIVLLLALLLGLGLLWNNANNTSNSTDEIYLYGEWHSDSHILDRELEIWGEYYKKGMRDLFVEYPYTDAQFLNLWMQADDDELLDQQFKDWEGTAGGTEIVKDFLKQIKKNYPKTVFHGTDVGHTWHSTGPRYLKYLKSTGQMDTEEYQRALLNIQQGKRYARIRQTNEEAAAVIEFMVHFGIDVVKVVVVFIGVIIIFIHYEVFEEGGDDTAATQQQDP